MTDGKTFTLTLDQIEDVFIAGCNRGSEEEAHFQSGCRTPDKRIDSFVNALWEAINGDKAWDDDSFVSIFTVEEWVKGSKT